MSSLPLLIKRNVRLFFKDRGMLFTSLITPAILLVLYVTFLRKVFYDSFVSALPPSLNLPESLINGLVGGELISSMLAVSCVTVTFCSNFLMVQDKVNGAARDLYISPVKPTVLSLGYYLANLLSSWMVCFTATGLCLGYLALVGWYLSLTDTLLLLLDVGLLVLFGSALSCVVNFFLSSQGQISAVGTVISSGYGFICGAYMPISSFGEGLQRVLSFLPGTYGTALVRNHAMQGALAEMQSRGIPADILEAIRASVDCSIDFFHHSVTIPQMYAVLTGSTALLLGVYITLNALRARK